MDKNFSKVKLDSLSYIRTDIAFENGSQSKNGAETDRLTVGGLSVTRTVFSEKLGNFEAGKYYTVDMGEIWNFGKDRLCEVSNTVSEILTELCEPNLLEKRSVTVVCLGNRRITSDALGPLASERLIVTRHIRSHDQKLFSSLGSTEISVICPGVTGDTGVETLELVRSAIDNIKPSVVICIDALASKSLDRLATTVQISSVGLSPGSGIGNRRKEISEKTLGVPVISIGVPTVVSSATLVVEALEKAGISEISPPLRDVLENGKSYFVSLGNADTAVSSAASVIAHAINLSLLGIAEL